MACAKAGTAATYRLIGDYDKAGALVKEAILLAEEHGRLCDIMQFRTQLGIIEYEHGNYEVVKRILNEAAEYF